MRSIILIKTAIYAMSRHPIQSLLTVFGIMIGVAAIIITFSIGRGAEEKIRSQIMSMGEGASYIIPGNVITRGATRSQLQKTIRLTESDLIAIREQVPEIDKVSRSTYTLELLEYAGNAIRERIMGTDENILEINQNKLKYGTIFTLEQLESRTNVVIIGEKIEQKLFGKEFPLGKIIRINGNPFTVIGVVEHQEYFWGQEDPDARSFIPFTVAKKYFRRAQESGTGIDLGMIGEGEEDLGAIILRFKEGISSAEPLRKIKRILRFRHNIQPGEEDDFTIFDQEEIINTAQKAASVIKLFGLIAASISLLVSGIGIMNIMLVSVQEHTKEIGLRIAIGATQHSIQAQFLIEAIVLCAIGGLIGIAIGLLGQWAVITFTHLISIFEFVPLFVSFLITILIGIFFGFYPAYKASLLNPIDALLER